jgi:Outer membrane protein beta-barrel domain
MDKNLHQIEDLFYSALEDNEALPSKAVWNELDKQLDKEKIVSIHRRYEQLKKIALILLLLFAGYVLFDLLDKRFASHKLGACNAVVPDASVKFATKDKVNVTTVAKVHGKKDKPLVAGSELQTAMVATRQSGYVSVITSYTRNPEYSIINTLPVKPCLSKRIFGNPVVLNAKIPTRLNHPSVRFSLQPFFSPEIAWYRLQDDLVTNQTETARELDKEEKHEFSYSYGVLMNYRLNKKWVLQSGLGITNSTVSVDPKTIFAQQDNTGKVKYRVNSSSGYGYVLPLYTANPAVGDSLYALTSTHTLQYLTVPLVVAREVNKGKFSFSARAGISADILLKGRLETTVEKGFDNSTETISNLQGLKKLHFNALAGMGIDYAVSRRVTIAFTPTLRVALTSINKGAVVKSYPTSFGFATGIKIGL